MRKTTYQVPEIRDENDNIIQEGTFGKKSAFVNSTNQGAFDYLLNNLEALHDSSIHYHQDFCVNGRNITRATEWGWKGSSANGTIHSYTLDWYYWCIGIK